MTILTIRLVPARPRSAAGVRNSSNSASLMVHAPTPLGPGPWQSLPPVIASPNCLRPGADLVGLRPAQVRVLRLDRAEAQRREVGQVLPRSIIRRMRPARNSARPAHQADRLADGDAPLGHGGRGVVAQPALERLADRPRLALADEHLREVPPPDGVRRDRRTPRPQWTRRGHAIARSSPR